ncbi:hypothetical protein [Pseudotabrizicola formosa]|uniref:hypothetical protein n=1 Tax=Pseudotabrizicola formosa TaxID=2030009 RepID=UPI0011AEEC4B|nr:hypothetical protein [Pseudotabrizicola formosa]
MVLPVNTAMAQQPMLEAVAKEVLTEFVTTCGAATSDPAGFVAASASIPGLRHVSSPDGTILMMGYDRGLTSGSIHELSVEVTISAIAPGVMHVMCGAGSLPAVQDYPAIDAAFRAVVDATPGTSRVGGKMPHYSIIGDPGDAEYISGDDNYLYFVTGWSAQRPTLHMYSDIGMIGIDLWTQVQIDAP